MNDTPREQLIRLATAFTDPNTPHPHPDDPDLIPSWNKCLAAADVIAEPTRIAAVLHLVKAWASVVDAHLAEQP